MGRKVAEDLRVKMLFDNCLTVDSVGLSGGLMLLWKGELDLSVLSFSLGHIDSCVRSRNGNFVWRFTGFYGNPVTA